MDAITFSFGNKIPQMVIYKNQSRFCYWAKAEMDIEIVISLLAVLLKWNDYRKIISESTLPIESIGLQIEGSIHLGNLFVIFRKDKITINTSIYKYNDNKSGSLSFEIEDEPTYEDVILSLEFAKNYKENNFSFVVCKKPIENSSELT